MVAAGEGRRFGAGVPKQFRALGGTPVLLHALRPFLSHAAVDEVVVVLPAAEAARPPDWLAPLLGERLRAVAGGAERMDSVEAGLSALGPGAAVVLVHDGARPFPAGFVIDAVIAEARHGRGAVAAVPVTDTLKEAAPAPGPANGRAVVARTVPRSGLWRARTPQGFPRALLEGAYRAARADRVSGTDDASLVERTGAAVVLVPDVETNLKVTTAEDLRLAEAVLGAP